MLVVLDSNVIVRDYFLRGIDFSVFLGNRNYVPCTIVVPELVIDEVVSRFNADLATAIGQAAASA